MKRKRPADETRSFEAAAARQAGSDRYVLHLYVAGATPRSTRAIQNLQAICEAELRGRYDLRVIDIYQHPEEAGREQVVAAPTLVKRLPRPVRRLIGDLADREKVLVGLNIIRLEEKRDG